MTKVYNLFAGPGSGKSTGSTLTFAMAKIHGINCEYVSEHAKDEAWQGTISTYYNPIHYLGEQHNRQFRLKDKVDFMITDSPLLQQAAYVDDPFYFEMCLKLFNDFDNVNFFIKRSKAFNPKGRKHNLEEAQKIDEKIIKTLEDNNIPFISVMGNVDGYNMILDKVLEDMKVQRRIEKLERI